MVARGQNAAIDRDYYRAVFLLADLDADKRRRAIGGWISLCDTTFDAQNGKVPSPREIGGNGALTGEESTKKWNSRPCATPLPEAVSADTRARDGHADKGDPRVA